MESLFGLPAHPLLLHAAVVIVPTAALLSVVLLARPEWRRRQGLAWVVFALVAFASTILANQSGEAFNEALTDRIGDLAEDHGELGNQTTLLVFLYMITSIGSVLAERRRSQSKVASVLATLAALLAVAATVWIVRTGHEGARIVWDGVL